MEETTASSAASPGAAAARQKMLQCYLCAEEYNEGGGKNSDDEPPDRRPVTLPCPCANTVCMSCAENWRASKAAELSGRRKMIPCPACNERVIHAEKTKFSHNKDHTDALAFLRDSSSLSNRTEEDADHPTTKCKAQKRTAAKKRPGRTVSTYGSTQALLRPSDAKVWNDELAEALDNRSRKDNAIDGFIWSAGANAIRACRDDIYVNALNRIIALPDSLGAEVMEFCVNTLRGKSENPYANDAYLRKIKFRGGPYAILMTLRCCSAPASGEFLTKREICESGQRFCDGRFKEHTGLAESPGAWIGIKTLKERGFVEENTKSWCNPETTPDGGAPLLLDRRHRFRLTRDGVLFADAMLQKWPTSAAEAQTGTPLLTSGDGGTPRSHHGGRGGADGSSPVSCSAAGAARKAAPPPRPPAAQRTLLHMFARQQKRAAAAAAGPSGGCSSDKKSQQPGAPSMISDARRTPGGSERACRSARSKRSAPHGEDGDAESQNDSGGAAAATATTATTKAQRHWECIKCGELMAPRRKKCDCGAWKGGRRPSRKKKKNET